MTGFMQGDAQAVDIGVRGHSSLNHAVRTQEVQSDFTLNPNHVDPTRDVTYGDQGTPVQYVSAKGGYEITGEQAALESARLLRYRPGGLMLAGQMSVIDAAPAAGAFELGLGRIVDEATWTTGDSEVFLRLDADGDYSMVIVRDGVETVIPRDGPGGNWSDDLTDRSWSPEDQRGGTTITDENGDVAGRYWGLDVFSGDGPDDANPSGVDIDPPVAMLPKFEGTYYGQGPFFLGFELTGPGGYQRAWPAVAFETVEQSILNQPTQPIFARYDDGGAGNTESFEIYGRQGSHVGDFRDTPITPWHMEDGLSWAGPATPITEADIDSAELILAYRRKPDSATSADTNYAGTEFGLMDLDAFLNQRTLFFMALAPDFGGQSPAWGGLNGVADDDLTPIQVATVDGSSNDLTADASTGRRFGGEIAGSGKNDPIQSGLDPVEQPNPRNTPVGVFALSLTGNAESDGEVKVKFSVNS